MVAAAVVVPLGFSPSPFADMVWCIDDRRVWCICWLAVVVVLRIAYVPIQFMFVKWSALFLSLFPLSLVPLCCVPSACVSFLSLPLSLSLSVSPRKHARRPADPQTAAKCVSLCSYVLEE